MERLLSNQVPRFLTSRDDKILDSPTEILLMLIFDSSCRVPITWNSVLLSFMKSLLERSQLRILDTQLSMAVSAEFSDIIDSGLRERYSWVSSA